MQTSKHKSVFNKTMNILERNHSCYEYIFATVNIKGSYFGYLK